MKVRPILRKQRERVLVSRYFASCVNAPLDIRIITQKQFANQALTFVISSRESKYILDLILLKNNTHTKKKVESQLYVT